MVDRIELTALYRLHSCPNLVLECLAQHAAHVLVRRGGVAPQHGVAHHHGAVLQIEAAAGGGGCIVRHGRRHQVGAVAFINTFPISIDARTGLGGVVHHAAAGHDTTGHHIQSTALYGLAVTHHAVAHMCPRRHDGSAATGVGVARSRHGRGFAVLQIHAVQYGAFVCARPAVRPLAEGHHMVAVHVLGGGAGRLVYRAEYRHVLGGIAGVVAPTVRIGFVVSAHHRHTVGYHVGVALRVVGIAQGISVVGE